MNSSTRGLRYSKRLISALDITFEEIQEIFYIVKTGKVSVSSGKIFLSIFFENSTRTLVSFEKAAKVCGFHVLRFDPSVSSLTKEETEINTIRTLCSMGVEACAIRTSKSGYTELLSRNFPSSAFVLNAGDGSNEHPTQGLLDFYTIIESFNISLREKCLKGFKIGIMGDILNSRVARSNIMLLSRFGAEITLISPPNFLPANFKSYYMEAFNCRISNSLQPVLKSGLDVLMCLRVQKERMESSGKIPFPSHSYCVKNEDDLLGAKLMHPGPINEGVEVSGKLAYESRESLVSSQVKNGVLIRSALLKLICG